jgi:hypothetical protein
MKRSEDKALPEWSRLALQFGEMWLASVQVIVHRTTRMAVAGPMPDACDRAEFQLMGTEKSDAASGLAPIHARATANARRLGGN